MERLQTGHDLRITPKVVTDRIAVQNQHGVRSEAVPWHVLTLHGRSILAQRKVRELPGQSQAVLWPIVRSIGADDVGNPAAFGYTVRFGSLLDQRLGRVVQV